VLDAYQTRQADAQHQVVEFDRRLAQLDKRKARLEEAYVYEQAIDRDTYTRHRTGSARSARCCSWVDTKPKSRASTSRRC